MNLQKGDSYSNWFDPAYSRKASSLYFGKGEQTEGIDTSAIDDHCCRLYTRPDFDMTWIWEGDQFFHDFCMDESDVDTGTNTVFNLNEIQWITSM